MSCCLVGVPAAHAVCGDNIPDAGEACDDGNLTDGDGCEADCTLTGCGDGVVTPPEVCDDGNEVDGDCCAASCLVITDQPPVCTGATPSIGSLWPPNHKSVPIAIDGVTDPDGDAVALTITAIAQDEPLDDSGDGATCPDASGVGTDSATVRSERSGRGDGRVYHIAFQAVDACQLSCTGTVEVCVRHDNGHGGGCDDGGPLYDSTEGAPSCGGGSSCDPTDCVPDPAAIAPCAGNVPPSVDERLSRARELLGRASRAKGSSRAHLGAKAARQLKRARKAVSHAAGHGKLPDACASELRAALDDAQTCAACGS